MQPAADSTPPLREDGGKKQPRAAPIPGGSTPIEQADERTNEANARTQRADVRTDEANTRTQRAEALTDEANVRTQQADVRSETLRVSELSYRRLFETARDGILILDFETGCIADVNPFLVELLGFSHGEMVGKTVGELSPFKDVVSNQAMLELLQKDGYVRYHDLPLETKDGRHVDVEFISNVYSVGEMNVIQCNIREITERKRVELALHTAQLFLAEVVNALPVRVFWKDQNLVYLGCNTAFARDAGFAGPKDIVGKDDRQMVWREQAEGYREDDLKIIASGQSKLVFEETQTTPAGKLITVLSSKLPLRNAKGEIIGVLGTYMDITERKRVQESHDRLAMAVVQASEAIVITDIKGAILYTNPAFEETTGYTSAEAFGQNPRILNSGKHDGEFYRMMWAVLERGEVWRGHFVNRRKDGRCYEEEATISPIRDAAGKVVSYVAVKRDVTHEVQLEAQFRQLQKMEGIGLLAGGIAHDFNNILAVIMMQTELASMVEHTPEEVRESLAGINAAAGRAANLTRQLLLFSRQQVLQPRLLDLNEVVTSLAKMLHRIIREDIHLQLHLHTTPLLTQADAGMLDQLLMNLAVNARDAMPKGGRLIIETAEKIIDAEQADLNAEALPGRFVWLSVSDTGCGMPPEIQARIFEPFFTTKEAGQGTGLGLATVFGIVKQHHGWIKVYSEVGKGTTFQVFLPATDVSAAEALVGEMAKPKPRGGTETILVVEDNDMVRSLTRAVLERSGYNVLEAADGVAAQQVWAEHPSQIALLLTDLVMPGGVDGRELAARLQSQRPGLKIILTSGYSAEIAGRELELKPGQNFIQKPCPPDQLLAVVRNCLDS